MGHKNIHAVGMIIYHGPEFLVKLAAVLICHSCFEVVDAMLKTVLMPINWQSRRYQFCRVFDAATAGHH